MTRFKTSIVAAVLFGCLTSSVGKADEVTDQCVQTLTAARNQRIQGQYRAAKESAQACSQPQCPTTIVSQCVSLFDAIRAEVPTIIFSARDHSGNAVSDVSVEIDGVPLTDRLDGRPVELDPGQHKFRFHSAQFPALEVTEFIRSGDRNRLLEVTLGEPPPPEAQPSAEAPAGTYAPTPLTVPPPDRPHEIPVASYVLAGVGVVGLGAFTYFILSGKNKYDEKVENCSPRCPPSDGDDIVRRYQLGYVSLGVGLAALASAATVYLVVNEQSDSASVQLHLGSAAGPGATVSGRF